MLSAIAVVALTTARAVEAGAPTDQLRGRVDRVLALLTDPEMATDGRIADRRAAMRKIAEEVFDFSEISRRSLARHWPPRTPAEREEFVRLFGELVERAYVSKIELYTGEKIEYFAEVPDGDVTTVRTRIITKQGAAIPVDYRMFNQDGRWRAYDVLIEGVSLVGNYRGQFNTVIQRSSYDELVKTLRVRQQEGAAAKPAGRASGGASPAPPRRIESP